MTRTYRPGDPCWIDLMTSDPDRSRAFYGEVFGWTSESAGPEFGGYVNFSLDGRRVAGAMQKPAESPAPDTWSVYLRSDDIDATVAAASANGASVHVPPMQVGPIGSMAFLADVGGAAIGVWQPSGGPEAHSGFAAIDEPGAPSWFELHTRDFASSVAFYETVFGWDAHNVADLDEFRYTTLGEGDEQRAGVMDATAWLPEGVPAHWSVYVQVADVDATIATATALGASVQDGPEDTPYGRLATLADPTGARFKLRG